MIENAELMIVQTQLEAMGLTVMAAQLSSVAERAAAQTDTYVTFLRTLLEPEVDARQERWATTRTRLANFPFKKTLADFDFTFQPAVDERLIRELSGLGFVERHENLILLGPPGVGKTHLAVALGMEAIRRRVSVYFTTAHALVSDLRQAQVRGTLTSRLRVYMRPKLLIVDELTYAPFEGADATNFFRLISERYEHGSTILTANRSYGEWGQVFNDSVLATAILDRLLHHSVTVNIKGGQSYRLKDKARAGLLPGQAEG